MQRYIQSYLMRQRLQLNNINHEKFPSSASVLSCLALFSTSGLYLYLMTGDIKSWEMIKWLDVFAEGGTTLLALFWLVLLMRSRPAGCVTSLLALGLSCFVFSWWMDFLDEFIKIPDTIFGTIG